MEKPEVIINVASSLDGSIASDKGALEFSSSEDWNRVHSLRNSVDAILVGINTIEIDDPQLTVRCVEARMPAPIRVVLDSTCKIPVTSRILSDLDQYPTLIITSKDAPRDRITKLLEKGAKILQVSKEPTIGLLSLEEILNKLKLEYNVNQLLVEGGSKVITQFLKQGLVDVLNIFYSTVFAGTINAKQLYEEEVVPIIDESLSFQLINIEQLENGFFVTLKPK